MFRPTGLFKSIACPKISSCGLQNCLFSHQAVELPPAPAPPAPVAITRAKPAKDNIKNERSPTPPPSKRRRIDDDGSKSTEPPSNPAKPIIKSILKKPTPTPTATGPAAPATAPYNPSSSADSEDGRYLKLETIDKRTGVITRTRIERAGPSKTTLLQTNASSSSKAPAPAPAPAPAAVQGLRALHTSPDQKNTLTTKTNVTGDLLSWGLSKPSPTGKVPEPERLIPRSVAKPPAQFDIRLKLLEALHKQFVRLHPESEMSVVERQKLIKLARDEEETAAVKDYKAYAVVLRNRVYALTKMSQEDFKKELDAKRKAEQTDDKEFEIDTTLTPEDEVRAIAGYVHPFTLLKQFDYVVIPPSEQEIETARKGVDAAAGDEECERCKSRFKMFLTKDPETGLYTTGGKCTHHWGRSWIPDRTAGQKQWQCCQQPVGETTGCGDASTHVFLIRSPKRLASQWQFVETPAPASDALGTSTKEKAICMDCEMGFTTFGLELIRLTVTRFPTYEPVIDILVKPLGEILDLNTRFSGVTQEQWDTALTYDAAKSNEASQVIVKAVSPLQAREILFKHIDASTIIVGHSLENDLKCTRVVHPRVVDTAILYPHRRGGGMRYSLKHLVRLHLGKYIQAIDTDKGHDSKEDANEAGNLVRKKIMVDVKSGKIGKDGIWTVNTAYELNAASKTENKDVDKSKLLV
ncbi:hypothetical protein H072_1172 [Dactylellina haptotyla CBS 200.50]|uniref:Exonuclease domain-containing protein n=1 Tax=Dactylellina haptotyla (strain CBS 200.50) TaxID=1284197 RepID=S8BZJ0_DACHA|nr:hypothetical protein H072_1172 [Dactylellina haptotyla CBS 200.50]